MICEKCGKEFESKYSKYSDGRFCSKVCARAFSTKAKRLEINQKVSKTLSGVPLNIKLCYQCGKELTEAPLHGRYCSEECCQQWRTKVAKTKNYRFKEPEFLDKILQARKDRNLNRAQESLSSFTAKKTIRNYLIKFRGSACQICGITEWQNQPISLEVHHIDGNNKNNQEENLQLLCPNCHSLTNTWRKKKTPI